LFVFDFFLVFKNRVDYVGIEVIMRRDFLFSPKKPSTNSPFFFFTLLDFLEWYQGEPKCSASSNHPPIQSSIAVHPSLPSVRGKRKHNPKSLHNPANGNLTGRDG